MYICPRIHKFNKILILYKKIKKNAQFETSYPRIHIPMNILFFAKQRNLSHTKMSDFTAFYVVYINKSVK